ncbi:MAG: hypothetical protein OJF58_001486 [Enhydrobacter sp.]|nr:MAG: hypothetical protein OJF58_001486 [Enhydrobacter sp.]
MAERACNPKNVTFVTEINLRWYAGEIPCQPGLENHYRHWQRRRCRHKAIRPAFLVDTLIPNISRAPSLNLPDLVSEVRNDTEPSLLVGEEQTEIDGYLLINPNVPVDWIWRILHTATGQKSNHILHVAVAGCAPSFASRLAVPYTSTVPAGLIESALSSPPTRYRRRSGAQGILAINHSSSRGRRRQDERVQRQGRSRCSSHGPGGRRHECSWFCTQMARPKRFELLTF